jgi:hypothetical protein
MIYYKKVEWGDQDYPDIWAFDSETNMEICLQDGEWLQLRFSKEDSMQDGKWEKCKATLEDWLKLDTDNGMEMFEYIITEEEAFMELI